jgi:hypothetical protein
LTFLSFVVAAAPEAAAGAAAAAVPDAAAAGAAGWLCANAGAAIAVVNATSAQIILLMANANALCFIFPFSLVSKATHLLCEESSFEPLHLNCGESRHVLPKLPRGRITPQTE